jgi:hypothetical protein
MSDDILERLGKAVERSNAIVANDNHDGLTVDFALMASYRLSEAATLITSLREALEPFAEYARISGYGRMVINDPTAEVFGIYSDEVAVVTKRDLARAARLAKKANPSRKETI